MNRVLSKSAKFGFGVGSILFLIAPLGLGISIIEAMKPVLVPGLLATQLLLGNSVGFMSVALAVLLNGVIYSILFFGFFASRSRK